MIKVSVMYPNGPGVRFDHDYYREKHLPLIAHMQVADNPGRNEPGTGEINYPAIARALDDTGYSDTIGLEAWASDDSVAALEAFRSAFS